MNPRFALTTRMHRPRVVGRIRPWFDSCQFGKDQPDYSGFVDNRLHLNLTRTGHSMRKEKAFLRNGLILGGTIVALIVVTILLARSIAG